MVFVEKTLHVFYFFDTKILFTFDISNNQQV
jgi:hypothetical protein